METAVIATGGKQYVVHSGDVITIEKLSDKEYKEGDAVTFEEVLLTDDGTKTSVGAPLISGTKVTGKVTDVGRGKKVEILKFKNKTRQHVRNTHRQPYMKVEIDKIG